MSWKKDGDDGNNAPTSSSCAEPSTKSSGGSGSLSRLLPGASRKALRKDLQRAHTRDRLTTSSKYLVATNSVAICSKISTGSGQKGQEHPLVDILAWLNKIAFPRLNN